MKNVLSAVGTLIRLTFTKIKYGSRLQFDVVSLVSAKAKVKISKGNSKIVLGRMVDIKENSRLDAVGGEILLGKNVFINRNAIIVSVESIRIGEYTSIGPNFVVYDHDHDYRNDKSKYVSAPVTIGKNVWIGANCTILKGVTIGDNVVVAAGSIITSDIPSDMIVYQKRMTEYKAIKPVREIERS